MEVDKNTERGVQQRHGEVLSHPSAGVASSEDTGKDSVQTQAKMQDDRQRVAQRQKQVDFGKNTIGYQRYIQHVPKESRRPKDPATPDVHQDASKRSFDGQVKAWRRALHSWDLEREVPDHHVPKGASMPRNRDGRRLAEVHAGSGSSSASGSEEGTDPCSSRGSLDGYLAPQRAPHGRKRALEKEPSPQQLSGGAPHSGPHLQNEASSPEDAAEKSTQDAKRTASTKCKDANNAKDGPMRAPTCFPTSQKVSVSHAPGTTALSTSQDEAPVHDNILSMILGSENGSRSAMSWASEDQPCL